MCVCVWVCMCAYIKLTLPELTIDFNNFLLLFFLSSLKPPPSLQISLLLPHAQLLSRSHSICLALSRSLSAIQRRSCSLSLLCLCAEYEKNTQCKLGSVGSEETRLTGVTSVNVSLEIVRLALTLNETDRGDTVHSGAERCKIAW